jgi:hypothetical protein
MCPQRIALVSTRSSDSHGSSIRGEDDVILQKVLEQTQADIELAKQTRAAENDRLMSLDKKLKPLVNEQLSFSIYFAAHFGAVIAEAFRSDFGEDNVASGEVGSGSSEGEKRIDISYSTRQSGLGFMISLKSVHRGERDEGNSRFTHNLKRNDEELRVEATALHLRQPYAVLVAVMILPFEACEDKWKYRGSGPLTSSFARWVEKLWTLKGRIEPEDPPNQFELVFVALYKRDRSRLAFYQVGGETECPRTGPPAPLLTFDEFVERVKNCYYNRNQRDFAFADEPRSDTQDEMAEHPDELE